MSAGEKETKLADPMSVCRLDGDGLLSLEAMLLSRAYIYALLHHSFGGEPTPKLLETLGSQATKDAFEEYYAADPVFAQLTKHLERFADASSCERLLDDAGEEYAVFFQGPADLPAYPWEGPNLTKEPTLFQPNVLAVRTAYAAQGLRMKRLYRMPDDHIASMMCFMEELAVRSTGLLRQGKIAELRDAIAAQAAFLHEHLNNWLPLYAHDACSTKHAFLYPQLIAGGEAFSRADEIFCGQVLVLLGELGGTCGAGDECCANGDEIAARAIEAVRRESDYNSAELFAPFELQLAALRALELRGMEDCALEAC